MPSSRDRSLIILGATGDLAERLLLPGLASLLDAGRARGIELIGASSSDWSDDRWRDLLRSTLGDSAGDALPGILDRARYVRTDATDADALRALLAAATRPPLLYLAVPPSIALATVEALAEVELPAGAVLVLEKPFGVDSESAAHLNARLAELLPEDRVFRVDHFLGKSTVANLIGLRAANRVIEAVWSREGIARLEIVYDESLALEGRAGYYDTAGALVDMIQSHLLLVLALAAMELPSSLEADDLHGAMMQVLRATSVRGGDAVASSRRARYTAGAVEGDAVPDYTAEEGVDPARATETLAEVVLDIATPRWAGVPVVLRSGKALGHPSTHVRASMRSAPHLPRGLEPAAGAPAIIVALSPERLSIELDINGAGDPSDLDRVSLDAEFAAGELTAYGEVLGDVLEGDSAFTVRGDIAEECWRIVEPVLEAWRADRVPLEEYPAGSNGPSGWAPLP
ncbi:MULTISPECIES: glucose-6-phosphate dehydrogenase [unclassified Microcella]|uniref:glucose-6-phosphate dehydrogenase n=1 Tax=unclassified Microcella TaxID=2630066 RepID=UPI0006F2B29A|nr:MULTISPECIES: glucose-6-phosphate dehydrogenase [unclassified Microcella]KQV25168.1 glucose-6-phosphate dehydrogenase [Yonghaparkia sp. Root332]KRF31450.1 glucose-6-phosphate dehydrogenase [Yonghaparkia sp. Soil809]